MNNDVPKERRIVIKQAALEALRRLPEISLPIKIKKIVKSYDNCRLIPYSRLMKDRGLSYTEVLAFTGTEHACTDYYAASGRYVIYYNDCDKLIISSNRYRWSIAHELGHVLLKHHVNSHKARLFRNQLSNAEYYDLEEEADAFASYILCPHAIMCFFTIKGEGDISALCKVSGAASWNRYKDFKKWRKSVKQHFPSRYDELVCWLYVKGKTCKTCATIVDQFDYRYCPICGSKKLILTKKEETSTVIYSKIELDSQGRAIKCGRCRNEAPFEEGDYCIICGASLKNKCLGYLEDNGPNLPPERTGPCVKSQENGLPGNARYCPYCGAETSFLMDDILTPGKKEWEASEGEATEWEATEEEALPF